MSIVDLKILNVAQDCTSFLQWDFKNISNFILKIFPFQLIFPKSYSWCRTTKKLKVLYASYTRQ